MFLFLWNQFQGMVWNIHFILLSFTSSLKNKTFKYNIQEYNHPSIAYIAKQILGYIFNVF